MCVFLGLSWWLLLAGWRLRFRHFSGRWCFPFLIVLPPLPPSLSVGGARSLALNAPPGLDRAKPFFSPGAQLFLRLGGDLRFQNVAIPSSENTFLSAVRWFLVLCCLGFYFFCFPPSPKDWMHKECLALAHLPNFFSSSSRPDGGTLRGAETFPAGQFTPAQKKTPLFRETLFVRVFLLSPLSPGTDQLEAFFP